MNLLVIEDEQDLEPLFLQRFRKENIAEGGNLAFAHWGDETLLFTSTFNNQQHYQQAIQYGVNVFLTILLDFTALKDTLNITNNSDYREVNCQF